jgi:hypothetical protein
MNRCTSFERRPSQKVKLLGQWSQVNRLPLPKSTFHEALQYSTDHFAIMTSRQYPLDAQLVCHRLEEQQRRLPTLGDIPRSTIFSLDIHRFHFMDQVRSM